MSLQKIGNCLQQRLVRTVLDPINEMVDEQITDITTTVGSFIIRQIRGKFQRSLTFTVGINGSNRWMETALFTILGEYNKINMYPKLELCAKPSSNSVYYGLADGVHNVKYKQWNLLLVIQTVNQPTNIRTERIRNYTIITYDLSPKFVREFEADMAKHRNSYFDISSSSPTVNVYKDTHEADGFTYWDKVQTISKRRLSTIYIPEDKKKLLVDTINNFFANKDEYIRHGIPWNLKILLHGPAGTGKSSIVKMIASEWNRNIFECSGGKNGRFIPNAITDKSFNIVSPLFSISDIDKYPVLINESDSVDSISSEEALVNKQIFNNMINALDGILSGEGRIIVMTTNHIEKFSDTFLRPGRIDLNMEIGYVTPEVFRAYVRDYYGTELPVDVKLRNKKLTIADMQVDVMFMRMPADEFVKKYTISKEEKK